MEVSQERRFTDPACWDAALVMGLLYTVIYGAMITMILFIDIPDANAKTVDILAGAMTIIQTTIVTYFFGSSKNAENTQKLIAQSKERTDSVLREVVQATVPVADPAATVKAADMNVEVQGDVTVQGGKK